VEETSTLSVDFVQVDRRSQNPRRKNSDRRQEARPVAVERRKIERRQTQRRRQIDPTTCERDYNTEEIEFMQALDTYKRKNGRMFPTCSEILEVIRGLGYVKSAGQGPLPEVPPAAAIPTAI